MATGPHTSKPAKKIRKRRFRLKDVALLSTVALSAAGATYYFTRAADELPPSGTLLEQTVGAAVKGNKLIVVGQCTGVNQKPGNRIRVVIRASASRLDRRRIIMETYRQGQSEPDVEPIHPKGFLESEERFVKRARGIMMQKCNNN